MDPAGIRREVFLTESGGAALILTVSILLQAKSGDDTLVRCFYRWRDTRGLSEVARRKAQVDETAIYQALA